MRQLSVPGDALPQRECVTAWQDRPCFNPVYSVLTSILGDTAATYGRLVKG